MDYSWAMEQRDIAKIDKLNQLTNLETFWDDVRKLTRNVTSDHMIKRWQCLADARFKELSKQTLEEYNIIKNRLITNNSSINWKYIEYWVMGIGPLPDECKQCISIESISDAKELMRLYNILNNYKVMIALDKLG